MKYPTTTLPAAQERRHKCAMCLGNTGPGSPCNDDEDEDYSTFYLLRVTALGYWRRETFSAPSLEDAASRALRFYRTDRSVYALVLRDGSTGKRYSVSECQQLVSLNRKEAAHG